MLGGPPGIGWLCNGGGFDVPGTADGSAFGSTSSHSELKSPELNLQKKVTQSLSSTEQEFSKKWSELYLK